MAEATRGRIALIDEDTALLSLMHQLLAQFEGYDVLICTEGDQAFRFVQEHRPDLVLLDVRMGADEMGWVVLEALIGDAATRPIPVIVCSAGSRDLQEREPQLREHDVDVLPKPFDLDVLLEKVQAGLVRDHRSGTSAS